jgi:predicted metal-dependent TIM-barrel fold hydrolase
LINKTTIGMNSISIPPSLTSKLEQIKQYMSKGRVTAFVGAGFSLNAEMPSHVQLKTWAQLRDDFLTKLYGNDEEAKSKDQNDVVQL